MKIKESVNFQINDTINNSGLKNVFNFLVQLLLRSVALSRVFICLYNVTAVYLAYIYNNNPAVISHSPL